MSDEDAGERPDLSVLEEAFGHRFADRGLLETAVTHSSWANERARSERKPVEAGAGEPATDNERLEFLGDSVIGMVVAQLLYRAHPEWREGELTRALHRLVDRRGLAAVAREVALGDHIRLGRTERRSDGHGKDSILADAMEAVIGAAYLDGGVAPVERFAQRVFADALAPGAAPVARDPKTRFQEWVMAGFGVFPTYRVVGDSGVEGDDQRFTSELLIEGRPVATGVGRSKRESERRAARDAEERRDAIAAELGPLLRAEENADG